MNLVFLTHPTFLRSQSMPRYAQTLAEGMKERGHKVEKWSPKARFFWFPFPEKFKKWMGYIDQYLVFPIEIRKRLKKLSIDTLLVFTDHALGPWVPIIDNRPHIIHCHDFLAQQSALGFFNENPTSWTGKQYQAYIKRGFLKGKNFVSVSQKTKDDLNNSLGYTPAISEVIFNAVNHIYIPFDNDEAKRLLQQKLEINLTDGYLLHVGGNQWYKNRKGVIQIYDAWRSASAYRLPLLLIGEKPDSDLLMKKKNSTYQSDIYFLSNISHEEVHLAYAGASVFLFPSLAEGFGLPIAEAMASGCIVITTNEAPMVEVAGDAAFFINRRPSTISQQQRWASESGKVVEEVLTLSSDRKKRCVEAGLMNSKRFNSDQILDTIENLYKRILQTA